MKSLLKCYVFLPIFWRYNELLPQDLCLQTFLPLCLASFHWLFLSPISALTTVLFVFSLIPRGILTYKLYHRINSYIELSRLVLTPTCQAVITCGKPWKGWWKAVCEGCGANPCRPGSFCWLRAILWRIGQLCWHLTRWIWLRHQLYPL